MRLLLGALALAATLTACSGPADEPAPLPARTTGSPAGAPTRYDQYVALGDSYTAAPLVPPTDTSTLCLRSAVNYPALVAEAMPGTALTDVSCSGASTRNTVRPQTGRGGSVPPQFDALRPGTDLVTIGLGGNDDQLFGSLLGSCVPRRVRPTRTGRPCTDAATGGRDLDRLLARIRGQPRRGGRRRSRARPPTRPGGADRLPAADPRDPAPATTCRWPPATTRSPARSTRASTEAVRDAAERADAEFVDVWARAPGTTSAPTSRGSTAGSPRPRPRWPTTRSPPGRRPSPGWCWTRDQLMPALVDRDAGHDRQRGRHRAQRRPHGGAVARRATSGSRSSSTRSPREPGRTIGCPSTDAGQRLADRQRLLGVPRLALVGAAVHGGGHRQPRVERRDRGVGAERELDAVVEHPPEREAPRGPLAPDPLGEVAVVEQVRGLHAGADAELAPSGEVLAPRHLHVLDRAARAGLGERRQRVLDGRVADRVAGDLEPAGVRPARTGRAARPRTGWAGLRGTRDGARRRTARSTRRSGC